MAKRPKKHFPRSAPLSRSGVPPAALAALLPDTPVVCAQQLHPVSALHWIVLAKIGSPLLQPKAAIDAMDALRALAILSTQAGAAGALVQGGAAKVDERALLLGAGIPAADLMELPTRLLEHLASAFDSVVKPDGEEKKTGSAGSSAPSRPVAPSTDGGSSTP